MRLEDLPLDIGYASEKVQVKAADGTSYTIGGQNGKTQLIVTAPFIDDALKAELASIDAQLPEDEQMSAILLVANETHRDPGLEKFDFRIDNDDAFGDYYGVRLCGEPCDGELTKAAFIISKDGAMFYDEIVNNLHESFNTDTLLRKIAAAQTCYTGKGCH